MKNPVKYVGSSQKDGYATVSDALNSITDSSATIRYTILVESGEHIIDNSAGAVQIKDFCNISAMGIRSVIFIPQDPEQDMFLGGSFTYLNGIVFSGQAGSSFVMKHSVAGTTIITDCVLRGVSNGFLLDNSAGVYEITNLAINSPDSTVTGVAIQKIGRAHV